MSSCCSLEYVCEFDLDQPEENRFPKGKLCFEDQLFYVYTEVIKVNVQFKEMGYYSETLGALSPSKTYFHIQTITYRHNHKDLPRNSSEGYRNSLCSRKTKYSWALNITLHYFHSILSTLLFCFFFHPLQMPFNSVTPFQFISPVSFLLCLN